MQSLSPKQEQAKNHVGDIESLALQKISGVGFREFLELHRRYPVIAITGQSGVGKTTFTRVFTERLRELLVSDSNEVAAPNVKVLTELPQMSPYLNMIKASGDSMADQIVWQKNQQLFLHLDQAIVTKAALESKDTVIIMDFAITQVQIYGDLKIRGKAGRDFRKEFDQAFGSLPRPDIIVHVSASSDTVLKRLAGRGSYIDGEIAKITETLNGYYNKSGIIEEYYDGTPIISVRTDHLDLLASPQDQMIATQEAIDGVLAKIAH